MTNIVTRSKLSRYYFCHLEYLEEQIFLRIYIKDIFIRRYHGKKQNALSYHISLKIRKYYNDYK